MLYYALKADAIYLYAFLFYRKIQKGFAMFVRKHRVLNSSKILKDWRIRYASSGSEVEASLSNGRPVKFSSGKFARFADGAAVANIGETSVMVTAVSKSKTSPSSFLPLTVDYRQKAAAAGRIPTNFLRREMGATEKEILVSRMIDRSLRPLFPNGYLYETQVICNLLAVDGVYDPEVLSINAASAALAVSDIPWNGPIGSVRVAFIDNEVIINPNRHELSHSLVNLVVSAAGKSLVVMLEASANDIPAVDFEKCIKIGVEECQEIVVAIENLRKKVGKPKRETIPIPVPEEAVMDFARMISENKVREILTDYGHDKISRDVALSQVRTLTLEKVRASFPNADQSLVSDFLNKVVKEIFRSLIFEQSRRCDGRLLTQVRPISCEVDLHKPLHGSALFQRGQTQVFCTVAFDSLDSALKGDAVSVLLGGLKEKNFFLHYEFPPYATNETGRAASYGRREVGHGALAEKGLRPVVPSNFPFTMRLTSEVLESNGSSSMAAICGGSLALMDAGVPLTKPAAGVAMGLVTRPANDNPEDYSDYRILTDILGIEDYLGDMDFKLAGTRTGITALQADVKVPGVPLQVVYDAIAGGRIAKNHILEIMEKTLPRTRTQKKKNWPIVEKLEVPAHKRSRLYGVGGTNMKKLTAETGVQISTIDETTFQIFAPNEAALKEGKEMIQTFLEEDREPQLDFGAIYKAKIVELRESGVMVTLYPNMVPTLLHNSQLDTRKVHHPSALGYSVGQEVTVKYFGRDPVSGQMRLSRKVLLSQASPVAKSLTKPETLKNVVSENK